ncbi:MAG: hypothetical protein GY944_00720 [bacterium]|nr:hypothetical protein [bacterium]
MTTIGVAFIQRESDAIYLSIEDATSSALLNGIDLSFVGSGVSEAARRALHLKRVQLTGTYRKPQPGDQRIGEITDLTLIFAFEDVIVE